MNEQSEQKQGWLGARFPWQQMWNEHAAGYYAPKNFNFWYYFGVLSTIVLVMQLLSGIWLAMFYTPTAEGAFSSVEYIMRDVKFGWLLRYLHSTGASAFFIVVYLHMLRGVMYGSFKKPRELLWLVGMFIYLVLLAEAFMGYLLPWGQMSFWGAQVITSLFSAIPVIGDDLGMWVRGDFNISGATLNRFYALHIVGMPLLLLGLVWMHIIALHHVGSNNPDGVEIKKHKDTKGHPIDGVPFHPYYTIKDTFGIAVFFMLFFFVAFFIPDMGGYFLEHANFSPADPMKTPEYIAPVWYMTPFYAILRAIPNKLFGVLAMVAAIFILFFLPWLDRSTVRSIRYRGWMFKLPLGLFVISFVFLGYLGTVHVTPVTTMLARVFAVIYFMFFILMPFYTKWDKTKPVPERISK
jgi:ubiquinol-cytochrome c reductase cytochrome b subunit